ncbi:uncharacterized protein LOC122009658 isoform X4 [Zingiber officinale]|uniref:uncharacterized protein LOC122009658 isoform X4 n=1 Tax=Zingiber officinale TaxID=94328 RepID=UPI001C4BD7A7|nr:uncharacterized protein LOC122009658 isoform X4 [Zingiber officinale]
MRIHELAEFLMKMQGESAGSALEVAAQAIIDSVKEVNPLKVFRKKKGLLLDSYRTLLTDGNTVHPPLGVHTVFVASSFGICLGFKDGIEKASEYFAGSVILMFWSSGDKNGTKFSRSTLVKQIWWCNVIQFVLENMWKHKSVSSEVKRQMIRILVQLMKLSKRRIRNDEE